MLMIFLDHINGHILFRLTLRNEDFSEAAETRAEEGSVANQTARLFNRAENPRITNFVVRGFSTPNREGVPP